MNRASWGSPEDVDESTSATRRPADSAQAGGDQAGGDRAGGDRASGDRAGGPASAAPPEVGCVLEGETASVTVTGELTEAARRPLVRTVTDLLLSEPALRRVELGLGSVPFMNSAGMALLVQLQRMVAPRGVELVLVAPPAAVVRPLQMTGLWRRFDVSRPEGTAPEENGAG